MVIDVISRYYGGKHAPSLNETLNIDLGQVTKLQICIVVIKTMNSIFQTFQIFPTALFSKWNWLWVTAFHHMLFYYKLHIITVTMWPKCFDHSHHILCDFFLLRTHTHSEVQTIVGLTTNPSKLHVTQLSSSVSNFMHQTCSAILPSSGRHIDVISSFLVYNHVISPPRCHL